MICFCNGEPFIEVSPGCMSSRPRIGGHRFTTQQVWDAFEIMPELTPEEYASWFQLDPGGAEKIREALRFEAACRIYGVTYVIRRKGQKRNVPAHIMAIVNG